jgi:hypothetical protein
MRQPSLSLAGVVLICSVTSCASTRPVPQPILERNDRMLGVEEATASQDLQTCRENERKTTPVTMQPRWLPPLGPSTSGVVLGTADFPHPVERSHEQYRAAIERCLTDRGYTVRGWQ